VTPRGRLLRIVILTLVLIAIASVVLVSVDAEEDSKAGATTAFALVIGAIIVRQWRRWEPQDPGSGS
jgi:hypothetical protein